MPLVILLAGVATVAFGACLVGISENRKNNYGISIGAGAVMLGMILVVASFRLAHLID